MRIDGERAEGVAEDVTHKPTLFSHLRFANGLGRAHLDPGSRLGGGLQHITSGAHPLIAGPRERIDLNFFRSAGLQPSNPGHAAQGPEDAQGSLRPGIQRPRGHRRVRRDE
jgi:hypothetical protein